MEISISHVVTTLKTKFIAEGLMKFFTIRAYSFTGSGSLLALDGENCILLEFATPQAEFPDIYRSSAYRLLILFNLWQESNFSPVLQNSLRRLQDKDNIDRIAIWSAVEVDRYTIEALKALNTDIIFVEVPRSQEAKKIKAIPYFIPVENQDLEYSLTINIITGHLIKRLRKMFHLVLSEIAAAIYNQYYGKTQISTQLTMEFEEQKLRDLVRTLKVEGKNKIAVDVGCGTGRHSFMLAKNFENVYAYDFSPRMIDEANVRKRKEDITNIIFLVNDFEYEDFLDEDRFYGECDLVIASFGMGSFIEDNAFMLRRFYDWLKPGGHVFISFYNANSITLNITPNWRDISLAAQVDKDNNALDVSLTPNAKFNIFCKPFDEGTKGEINKILNIDRIITYPTIMALLPNSLLENEFARDFFKHADESIANGNNIQFNQLGYYVTVIAHKTRGEPHGYTNIEQILKQSGSEYEILDHKPVLSIEDVKREIGHFPECIIKTIIFKNKKTRDFIAVSIQAEKQVDRAKIAAIFGVKANKIKFASEKDVLHIGFPIGGIAPFGFEENVKTIEVIDAAIAEAPGEWLYTGIGNNRKTLKIKKQDFLKIVSEYQTVEL